MLTRDQARIQTFKHSGLEYVLFNPIPFHLFALHFLFFLSQIKMIISNTESFFFFFEKSYRVHILRFRIFETLSIHLVTILPNIKIISLSLG